MPSGGSDASPAGVGSGADGVTSIPYDVLMQVQAGTLDYTYKGITTQKNPFDLALYLEMSAAGTSDDLDDTVNYGAVADLLAAKLGDERFFLLERMAQRTAELVLSDPLVEAATVTVRKIRPPVPVHVDTTGVRIHRTRASVGSIDDGPGA